MAFEHVVIDVDQVETSNQNVNDLGSTPPPPPSGSGSSWKHDNIHESQVEAEFNSGIDDTKSKKSRKMTSDVWQFFENEGFGKDGKPHAKCKGCGESYVAGGNRHGTSTLSRHMGKCMRIKVM